MRRLLLASYLLYALLIVFAAVRGSYRHAGINALILGVLVAAYFVTGRKDRFSPALATATLLFVGTLTLGYFGIQTENSIIGIDKLFHFIAGGVIAWFGLLYFEKKASGFAFYVAVVSFAVAGGAWWEVFEWAAHMYGGDMAMVFYDTVLDIVADTLGAVFVCAVYHLKK